MYDDAASLTRLLGEHKSWAAASRATGVPSSTLKTKAARFGIRSKPTKDEGVQITVAESADETLVKENELLRLENARLRRSANKETSADLASERVVQRLEEAIKTIRPSWEGTMIPVEERGDRTAQEAVLLWSDLHAAEVVSLEETRGINEYNWSIMEKRMADAQRAVFSHTDHFGFNINTLHIPMLGDMLSGDIHEELKVTNDRPLTEAVVDLAEAHVPWLLGFADRFPLIKISGVPGNHPRATQKPQAKQAHNNADWLFYQFLKAMLKGHPQFEFDIARGSFNVITLADRWRALLMHGDGIRSTMPGVPWGGVIRRITVLESQFVAARTPLDFVFLGHFHTRNALDGVNSQVYMNGSLKGADEYSLKMFGSGRPAAQSLMTFHPKRGWTGSYAMNLQSTRPGSEGW